MESLDKLWRTWGNFYDYPECCVAAFIHRDICPDYLTQSPFDGSGFVPCEKCHEVTKNLNKREALGWLGRDPFSLRDIKDIYQETLDDLNTEKFHKVSVEVGYDYTEYKSWLGAWSEKV